jgi:hypothetical protein
MPHHSLIQSRRLRRESHRTTKPPIPEDPGILEETHERKPRNGETKKFEVRQTPTGGHVQPPSTDDATAISSDICS